MSATRIFTTFAIALLACAFAARPAAAQEHPRTWLGLGVGGASGASTGEGMAVMGELVHQRRANHLALRGLAALDPYGDSGDAIVEAGLIYGRASAGAWGHAMVGAGVALTGFGTCAGTDDDSCVRWGAPVVAEASLRLARAVGVGVQGFTNLNSKSVYGGVILFAQLGWMP